MARKKSEFLSAFGTAFQVFKAITDEVLALGGTDEDVRAILNDPEKCRAVAFEIVGRNRIMVPDLSAVELVAQAQTKLGLTYLNPSLATWDFYKNRKGEVVDAGGKTHEVKVWAPGCPVSSDDVRKHFPKGFHGNTAAFVALMVRDNPEGYHASIPEDDRLFPGGDCLCAPSFNRDDHNRYLDLGDVRGVWYDDWCFVTFREFTG